jgi:hypothetical protein
LDILGVFPDCSVMIIRDEKPSNPSIITNKFIKFITNNPSDQEVQNGTVNKKIGEIKSAAVSMISATIAVGSRREEDSGHNRSLEQEPI